LPADAGRDEPWFARMEYRVVGVALPAAPRMEFPGLVDRRPRTRYLIGTDAKLSAFLKRNLPDRWMDAIIFRLVGLPQRVALGTPTYVL
jgi:hypothetical protein